jgi:hypothetical protein
VIGNSYPPYGLAKSRNNPPGLEVTVPQGMGRLADGVHKPGNFNARWWFLSETAALWEPLISSGFADKAGREFYAVLNVNLFTKRRGLSVMGMFHALFFNFIFPAGEAKRYFLTDVTRGSVFFLNF